VEPADPLHISVGGIGELFQGPEETAGSAAAFWGADWELPGALPDLLGAEVLWTSGKASGGMRAFTPVSGVNAGRIFEGGLGALLRAGLTYRVRPNPELSLEGGGACFIRTDRETLADADINAESESRIVGEEVYGSLIWAPDSAFRFNAGGGVFFPGRGGAFREDAPLRWKTNAGLLVSL
jgi:hypothetical protein